MKADLTLPKTIASILDNSVMTEFTNEARYPEEEIRMRNVQNMNSRVMNKIKNLYLISLPHFSFEVSVVFGSKNHIPTSLLTVNTGIEEGVHTRHPANHCLVSALHKGRKISWQQPKSTAIFIASVSLCSWLCDSQRDDPEFEESLVMDASSCSRLVK